MTAAIRLLEPTEIDAHLYGLAALLIDAVEGGASVGFMAGLGTDEARAFWRAAAADPARLVAAADGDVIVGAVLMAPASQPNQPHRADIRKLLVRRSARRRGVGSRLMAGAEAAARGAGRTLLVLDTAAGSEAEPLYAKLGWSRSGIIPDYALWPDGRPCDTVVFYKRLGA